MIISEDIKIELEWWIKNLKDSKQSIEKMSYDMEIFSDASNSGWGAFCKKEVTHGFWNDSEENFHINYLELLAAFYALKSFVKNKSGLNILLRVDNITAISCINRMGSVRYRNLNNITRRIWTWCEARNIFIYASYISSSDNKMADAQSRMKNSNVEYNLDSKDFQNIIERFGAPSIDLFASYQNKKCDRFVSRFPDPESTNGIENIFMLSHHFHSLLEF